MFCGSGKVSAGPSGSRDWNCLCLDGLLVSANDLPSSVLYALMHSLSSSASASSSSSNRCLPLSAFSLPSLSPSFPSLPPFFLQPSSFQHLPALLRALCYRLLLLSYSQFCSSNFIPIRTRFIFTISNLQFIL